MLPFRDANTFTQEKKMTEEKLWKPFYSTNTPLWVEIPGWGAAAEGGPKLEEGAEGSGWPEG